MVNPFEKRATEYLADTEAFLAVVTPEPLITFFKPPAQSGTLYDRLAIVTGTPGSGKTTLARLFEYSTLRTLLRHRNATAYRSLADALTQCAVLDDFVPMVIGARVPLESEYREFWEFPYPEDTRMSLTSKLLQARTMIRWLRQIGDSGVRLSDVEIVPRTGAEAALQEIGGNRGDVVLQKARETELAIYKVVRALVPPSIDTLAASVRAGYHPFDVVESFRFPLSEDAVVASPLVMFDDAHSLHPAQYERLERWLSQREMKIARWILTRLDALNPANVLGHQDQPDVQKLRVTTEIRMQPADRRGTRTAFRKMARDMSSRYLRQIDAFNRRSLSDLGDLLPTESTPLPRNRIDQLERRLNSIQRRVGASDTRRRQLRAQVEQYLASSTSNNHSPEVVLAATAIALERFGKRTPQLTFGMFGDEDVEPNKPISIDSSLIDGARIHLLHSSRTPYYYGFESLCDASSENAEQFLQLAARLVEQAETQLIRGKQPAISPTEQDRLLRRRAEDLINAWDFPYHREVRRLSQAMAAQCLARSLEGNAPLGGGANAWGIPQDEFMGIVENEPHLARVLHFAVAYNAILVKLTHSTKNRMWCLLELGGPVVVSNGLTLRRGGFLERTVDDLLNAIAGDSDA